MAKSKAKIEKEIKELKDAIASGVLPASDVAEMESTIKELEAERDSAGAGAPATEKKTDDGGSKKSKRKYSKRGTSERGKKTKAKAEKKKAETPDCNELERKFKERRAASKASAHKAKTKSVFAKVSDKVEGAVVQAIKSVPAADIKENPHEHISAFKELEKSAERFMRTFKAVVGDEYDAKEIEQMSKAISAEIEKAKKKYEHKKAA